MQARNSTHINPVFEKWPLGALLTVKILKKKGFTDLEINNYQKSKVITPLGKEIFKKTSEQLSWEGVVYGLQQHYENRFIVGGKTALELLESKSCLLDKGSVVNLLSFPLGQFPSWLQKIECGVIFKTQHKNILPPDVGVISYDCGGFSINISSPERATLEMLALAKTSEDFTKCSAIFSTLSHLSADVLQNLLENCSSDKTKSTFLLLASQWNHPWFKNLDLSRIKLGEKTKNKKRPPLLPAWPANTVMTTRILRKKGFTYCYLQYSQRVNLITPFGTMAFKKTSESPSWKGVVYGLQQHHENQFIVGGKTAFDLMEPLVLSKGSTIYLFSDSPVRLPKGFREIDWGVQVQCPSSKILSSLKGVIPYDCGGFSINISCPERAVLEMLALAKTPESFKEFLALFKSLNNLKPDVLQELLENCSSVSVKKLFLDLASHLQFPWFQKLDLSRIELRERITHRKLKSLFPLWPSNTIMTAHVLREKGLTYNNFKDYRKKKWITSLDVGVFKKTSEQLSWEGVVYGLQQHYKNRFIVGGKTALDLLMFESPVKEARICLVSIDSRAIPQWIQKVECGRQFQLHTKKTLSSLQGVVPYDCGEFSIDISCPERAIFEMIALAKTPQDFKEIWLLFKELNSLNPPIIQNLLESCSSFKVKKIFLLFASHAQHPWFEKLNLSDVTLGKGIAIIIKKEDIIYNSPFQIGYPQDLFED